MNIERNPKPVIKTDNFAKAIKFFDRALRGNKLAILCGESGLGKTTSISVFIDMNPENVKYVRVDSSQSSIQFWREVCGVLGINNIPKDNDRYSLIVMAAEYFSRQKENMLLIIDQANKMKPTMFEYIHDFRNFSQNNTGVVLVGTKVLNDKLLRWKKRGVSGIDEFYGRVAMSDDLFPPKQDEIPKFIRARGIDDINFIQECLSVSSWRELDNRIDEELEKVQSELERIAKELV